MEDLDNETLSYTRENLDAGTTHYLRVRSFIVVMETRYESAWSSHVTGMTDLPRLPVPTGLTVDADATDHDSIRWEWVAVAGVDSYDAQFSTSQTFVDTDQIFNTDKTSHVVHQLDPETNGYLRVRSVVGTGSDARRSEWSDTSTGTTTGPPAATALAAPDDVRTTDESEDTIALAWDSVSNAATYVVGQRVSGGTWGDASCGGEDADNEVGDEECLASGLESGTDYEFRVRAVPSSADSDRYNQSPWSDTLEARTEGTARRPTTSVPGGMGTLNVTWEADAGITWSWEPVAGATYQWKVVTTETDLDFEAEDPCGVAAFDESGTEFSETSATGPALLCVRTMDEDDDKKDLSWAFATTRPSSLPAVGDITPSEAGEKTMALTWDEISVPSNFRYDINIVAEGGGISATPTDDDLQEACSAGVSHESDETDVGLTGLNTTFTRSLQPYTGYLLCLRYGNQRGETEWVAADGKHYTAPGQAPRPTKDKALSTDDLDQANETVVWNVATRSASGVPRLPGSYDFKVIEHPSRHDATTDTDSLHDDTVTKPTAAKCGDSTFDTPPYTLKDNPSTAVTSSGFTVKYLATRPDTLVTVRTTGTTEEILPNIVSLCVQAKYGSGNDERKGPWNISPVETVAKQNPSS